MIFSTQKPPNWSDLEALFGIEWDTGYAVAYEGMIYSKYPLRPDVYQHELVHLYQQGQDSAGWWKKYLYDSIFRFEQEAAAYQEQWKFIQSAVRDRNQCFSMKRKLALDISGPMYGNLCTYAEALTILDSGILPVWQKIGSKAQSSTLVPSTKTSVFHKAKRYLSALFDRLRLRKAKPVPELGSR